MRNIHINILTRTEIIKNVSCIKRFDNVKKQKIYEALIILKEWPSIKLLIDKMKTLLISWNCIIDLFSNVKNISYFFYIIGIIAKLLKM